MNYSLNKKATNYIGVATVLQQLKFCCALVAQSLNYLLFYYQVFIVQTQHYNRILSTNAFSILKNRPFLFIGITSPSIPM